MTGRGGETSTHGGNRSFTLSQLNGNGCPQFASELCHDMISLRRVLSPCWTKILPIGVWGGAPGGAWGGSPSGVRGRARRRNSKVFAARFESAGLECIIGLPQATRVRDTIAPYPVVVHKRAMLLLLTCAATAVSVHHGNHVERVLGPDRESNATVHFYNHAVLDHFDGVAGRTFWKQRYYVDQTHWCGNGCPIFLYIGGEGPQGPPSDRLFMGYLASKMGALMIALEHRYYGKSLPVGDMSVANLKYLSSAQALADLARFIEYLTVDYQPFPVDVGSTPPLRLMSLATHSKLVSFGGSYPGALSAWLPLKFPASLAGAVASSAPVHADYNFVAYADVTGTAFAAPSVGGSPQCTGQIQEAITALHALVVGTTPPGTDPRIPPALRPCPAAGSTNTSRGMSSALDLATYEAGIYDRFQETVQYNREEPAGVTVEMVCAVMTNKSMTPLERLAAAQLLWPPLAGQQQHTRQATPPPASSISADGASTADGSPPPPPPQRCVPASFDKDTVAELTNITFDGHASGRQWVWQSCNEFGFFQTTQAKRQHHHQVSPFVALSANSIEAAGAAVCKAAFGITTPPATDETNRRYGGRAMLAQNVTVVNGNLDPWHALGIVTADDPYYMSCISSTGDDVSRGGPGCEAQRVAPSSTIILVDSTAHCGDMYAPNLFNTSRYCPGPACHVDPPSLVAAHKTIEANVRAYIQ